MNDLKRFEPANPNGMMMLSQAGALPALIRAMMRPEFYAGRPESIELRQTHISYVILAGDEVYKLKKTVRFAFLDYSTLEKRRHFCHEEIRLNRRLAPEVYLEVVGIVQRGDDFSIAFSEEEKIVEYAVKMRRLPEEYFFDRLVQAGRTRAADADRIAARLARFYAATATDRASLYGSADAIRRNVEQNLKELEPFIGETLDAEEYKDIRNYSAAFLTENVAVLESRVRDGRVREGHGDLRAEHICLEGEPVVFDCIEFNQAFRYCDAASETAFLSMDLDYLGAPVLADRFAASFQHLTSDPDLARLLPLYKAYRACVRGKVETLKSREAEVPDEERREAQARARRYFHLAHRYARGPLPPAIVVVCGLAGSGKSTIARILGARTRYQILNSDIARKRLAGISSTTRAGGEYGKGLYSESFNALTYDRLLKDAEERLQTGEGVIVDATFKEPQRRQKISALASRLRLPALFVECRASEETTLRRLKERQSRSGEVSDATTEVYLRQREEFVPLSEIPDSQRLILSTEADPEEAAGRALHSLDRCLAAPR